MFSVLDPYLILQRRIRELREEAPWESQTEVGEAVGVKQKVVSAWETGASRPTYEHLVLIAQYFQVTTDYLLGVTDQPQGKVRELSEDELRTRLFEFVTNHAPEVLQHVARFLERED